MEQQYRERQYPDRQYSPQGLGRRLKELAALMTARGLTLVTAESCTGGLLGGRITSLPGSSSYYKGGVISYANEVKEKLLAVEGGILAEAGAVSPQTAAAMASGAIRVLGGDMAVAVTGIAGPEGGGDEKPVGLVYIGISYQGKEQVFRFQFAGGRHEVRRRTVAAAIGLVLETVKGTAAAEER
jgi:PncC family amidohydrolase